MQYINEDKINQLIKNPKLRGLTTLNSIISKAKKLNRLSLEEVAVLLSLKDKKSLAKIFAAADFVKQAIYGQRIVLFAPLYISNLCSNGCLYCAFKNNNDRTIRRSLTIEEIKEQVKILLKQGHKRILLVAGEFFPNNKSNINYYLDSIKAIYSVKLGQHKIRRVNINCAPLNIEEFKRLKKAGIGTYQLFQETYHQETYAKMHPYGQKSDPNNRLEGINRAIKGGIDDIGVGVLFGLYDYKFETLALLSHIEYLENTFGFGPHTISVPRIEPAQGTNFSIPSPVTDEEFKKIVAILRLAVPYTGIILSTRESPNLRNQLFKLGVSQISAGSRTDPGGYKEKENFLDNNLSSQKQFSINDQRSLDEINYSLIKAGFIPSFCAACYRKARTGKAFMHLAKPGNIKNKCSINALITLKEYLVDFASPKVKVAGDKLIKKYSLIMNHPDRKILDNLLTKVKKGIRDEYV